MSRLSAKMDTVEEFWDPETVEHCFNSHQDNAIERFQQQLREYLNPAAELFLTTSGRTALELFLRGVSDGKREKVLICSYNCYVVANAVTNAGLTVATFDIDEIPGKIDWQQVSDALDDTVLAIVIPHLFGVPVNFRDITGKCARLGIYIVEDCCHTFGAQIGTIMAGTIGDAAMISFNYDKPISLGGGGGLLLNNLSIAKAMQKAFPDLPPPDSNLEYAEMCRFVDYLRQRREEIGLKDLQNPAKLPDIGRIGNIRATLGLDLLARYDEVKAVRNCNAAMFSGCPGISGWHVADGVVPAWLKQRVTVETPERSQEIAASLREAGYRVGNHNWRITIDEIMGYPLRPNARHLAQHGLDVPVHQNMTIRDIEFICAALQVSKVSIGTPEEATA